MMLWKNDFQEMPNFRPNETYKFHALAISKSVKFGQVYSTQETSIDQGPVLQIVIQTLEN